MGDLVPTKSHNSSLSFFSYRFSFPNSLVVCLSIVYIFQSKGKSIVRSFLEVSFEENRQISLVALLCDPLKWQILFSIANKLECNFLIYLLDFFYVVTYFDRAGLYCTSKNLYFTFTHVTSFCILSGA